jgi:glycogen synthase kinase 3 beta
MKELFHPCVVEMKNAFFTKGEKKNEDYLNIVMEFVPDSVQRTLKVLKKQGKFIPEILIKVYSYQLLRALAYIHSMGICHRDIKPSNLLVDPKTHNLKLADFGSAKRLVSGDFNCSYITSRHYRAPELIFGATGYSHAIDIWSAGCTIAELFLGEPLFQGESGIDQLVEIIKVLGTPTRDQIHSMNKFYMAVEWNFPFIGDHDWSKIFSAKRTSAIAIDLISQMVRYEPNRRINPL